ncbi:hypothetical protein [Thiomicrospira cyclica]|uniref:Uncharacterized protein n=1 Tax=Thiomicrospira cyclica (strain DSM 14477 / JCM 11371 / ALM1) TaxID=717773 RepID=F6DCX1_THICA|nr:hypothetical protein [Thiomicrospira cyclica]AEG31707.1 hypothetical protein Thicy_0940 [Thiomicrospira cyclica ALM1]
MSAANRPTDLYLVSSSLHFFWAWLLAAKNQPQRDAHLWLIDQYTNQPLAFTPLLNQVATPFTSTQLWAGRELSGWQKFNQRKQDFNQAKKARQKTDYERILIGNDRSVFGQYVMQLSNTSNNIALDDGVFSYLGREASKSWHERVIDQALKKISYGNWYDSPSSIGASKWIDSVWLMYPTEANALLNNKSCHDLDLNRDDLNAFQPIAELLIKQLAPDLLTTKAPDVLIALPNYYLIKATPDYPVRLAQLITHLQQQGQTIAVKYHPAAQGKDLLNLNAQFGIQCLNDQLSFEVLLAHWQDQTVRFIGDLSTTTFLAHYFGFSSQWLPGVQTAQTQAMQAFCQKLGITAVTTHD